MNPRWVLALGLLALIVLTLALMMGRDQADPLERPDEPVLPGLRDQVNDVAAIDIVGIEEETHVRLRRERDRWRVMEKSGYEADFALVHDLLRDLAEARRVEERTSNPQWYPRLGVADPGTGGSPGAMVTFPETDLPEVIVGIADGAGTGRYMRIHGEATSWLTDRAPDVPVTPLDWLERAIMDIPASELAEITIRHPDGDTVQLRPAGEERQQWVLLNVPEGREAVPSWRIQPAAGALTALNLQDVRENDEIPDQAVRALYRTRDGLNFVASLFEDDQGYWVNFTVSAETAAREHDALDEADTTLAVDAAAVHGRLSPWQFAITEERFGDMTYRLEDLLADPDD